MFGELFESINDLISNGVGNGYNDGSNHVVSGMEHLGIDMSMYDEDEIREALKSVVGTGENGHNYGHDITFGASHDVDARNMAKSTLLTNLSSNHIHTSSLTTDKLWGGLDYHSGSKVYDAINNARDNGRISESVYKDLMAQLKKACHTQ